MLQTIQLFPNFYFTRKLHYIPFLYGRRNQSTFPSLITKDRLRRVFKKKNLSYQLHLIHQYINVSVKLLKIKLLMLLSCQAGKSWIIKQQWRAKSLNKQEQLAEGNTGRSFHGSIISKQYTQKVLRSLIYLILQMSLYTEVVMNSKDWGTWIKS